MSSKPRKSSSKSSKSSKVIPASSGSKLTSSKPSSSKTGERDDKVAKVSESSSSSTKSKSVAKDVRSKGRSDSNPKAKAKPSTSSSIPRDSPLNVRKSKYSPLIPLKSKDSPLNPRKSKDPPLNPRKSKESGDKRKPKESGDKHKPKKLSTSSSVKAKPLFDVAVEPSIESKNEDKKHRKKKSDDTTHHSADTSTKERKKSAKSNPDQSRTVKKQPKKDLQDDAESPSHSKNDPEAEKALLASSEKIKQREAELYAQLQAASAENNDSDNDEDVEESAALRFGMAAQSLDKTFTFDNEAAPSPDDDDDDDDDVDEEMDGYEDDFEDFEDDDDDDDDDDDAGVDDKETADQFDFTATGRQEDDGGGGDRGVHNPVANNSENVNHEEMEAVIAAMQSENQQSTRTQHANNNTTNNNHHNNNNNNHHNNDVDDNNNDNSREDDVQTQKPKERIARPFTARVNFGQANKTVKNKASLRSRRRFEDLKNLIELSEIDCNLFEQAPMSEYELYMRNYGSSNTAQIGTQFNDDRTERDTQTDKVKMKTRWTQEPSVGLLAAARDDGGYDSDEDKRDIGDKWKQENTQLSKFIERVGPTVLAVLEEDDREAFKDLARDDQQGHNNSNLSCSTSSILLSSSTPFLAGRFVISVNFSLVKPELLIAAYSNSPVIKNPEPERNKGYLCVWNTRDSSAPQKILTCESSPKCCCFDPFKATLVFAGTEDGSVVLWDLRESPGIHKYHTVGTTTHSIRHPTYSTEGITSADNHAAPIVDIKPIFTNSRAGETSTSASSSASTTTTTTSSSSSASSSSSNASSSSFQIATLDSDGVFKTWTVLELAEANTIGSLQELGLHPGGRVKISASASIQLDLSHFNAASSFGSVSMLETFCFQFFPDIPNQLIAGTNQGAIIHAVRFGGRVSPRVYTRRGTAITNVTSLTFSPFFPTMFLAGFENGDIALFRSKVSESIVVWPSEVTGGVKWIQWSQNRPAVYFVVSNTGVLYVWNLLENDGRPHETHDLATARGSNRQEVITVAQPQARTTTAVDFDLAVTYKSGSIDCHQLESRLMVAVSDEVESMQHYFDSLY